jgi:hypothetical protein
MAPFSLFPPPHIRASQQAAYSIIFTGGLVMKSVSIGVLLTAGIFASHAVAQPALTRVALQAMAPLSNAARQALGRAGLPNAAVSGTISLTVAAPKSQGASLGFTGASQIVTAQGYAQFPANPINGESSWADVNFTGIAATAYIVECGISGVTTASMGVQIGTSSVNTAMTSPVDGRVSVLVPAQAAGGSRHVMVAGRGGTGWRRTGCTISTVK